MALKNLFLALLLGLTAWLIAPGPVQAYQPEYLWNSATSAVVKIYSEPGDGFLIKGKNYSTDDWSDVHDSVDANFVDYNGNVAQVYSGEPSWGPLTYVIGRSYLSFDKEDFFKDADITKIDFAYLSIKAKSFSNQDNDGLDYIALVKSFSDYNDKLIGKDFEDCGYDMGNKFPGRAKYTPITEGSNRLDFSEFAKEKYLKFDLNKEGIKWLFDEDYIKLGIREGHDLQNIKYNGETGGKNKVYIYMSESGIDNSPFLTIKFLKNKNLNPVVVIPGIVGSWYSSEQGWLMDPILHTYDDLLAALRSAGYEDGKTLFPMPYNWRQDNTFSAFELGQKVEEIIASEEFTQVDIVAHSMGGLVARQYLADSANPDKVDQLVFLGTPHQGAPKAYPIWEAAAGFDSLSDKALRGIIKFEADSAGAPSLLDYIRSDIASLYQLLPTYQYLRQAGAWRAYDSAAYPDNYPYNHWLAGLSQPAKLAALADSGVGVYNLTGEAGGTITLYEVGEGAPEQAVWPHGELISAYHGAGDGTVPAASSDLFASTQIPGAGHRQLPAAAREKVVEILTGSGAGIPPARIPEIEHLLIAGVLSPVDFQLTGPEGRELGRDLPGVGETNQIPLAFYSGADNENEYSTIPNPGAGEYYLDVLGTGSGTYKVSADVISEKYGQALDNYAHGVIKPGQSEKFRLILSYDGQKNASLRLYKITDPARIGEAAAELCELGEINRIAACNYLNAKFTEIKNKISLYRQLPANDQGIINLYKNIVSEFIRVEDKILFYLDKEWLSKEAKEILFDEIDGILYSLNNPMSLAYMEEQVQQSASVKQWFC